MESCWQFTEWGDDDLARRVQQVAADVDASIRFAPSVSGGSLDWQQNPWHILRTLATLGAVDLTAARTIEPHLDAVTILTQAGSPDLSSIGVTASTVWGVYAAGGPGHGLLATQTADGHFELSGTKPWCSLGDRLDHALLTAAQDGHQRLFAVRLDPAHCTTEGPPWQAVGLPDLRTVTLRIDSAEAIPVGESGWYLSRPGFAWGGIGVAAVWFGAAAALAGRLRDAAEKREPDQVALVAIGHCDRALYAALLALRHASDQIASGEVEGAAASLLAARTRAVVVDAVEQVITVVGHALGPAPLAYDPEHARRVADLTLYIRQHHAERDLAALGRMVVGR